MRIHWHDQFKDGFKSLEANLKDPAAFKKALNKAAALLQTGKDISESFTVNRLINRGEGWCDCYITPEIVMGYRIQGQYVTLTEIGLINEMYERCKIFWDSM